ncbi:CBO0543 family protein [Lentibacillus sediminis]|uniref:CBO0543 family protein n=1 Tax=Lentibacillus sediminis TaxID=1940529 RepID=UPI000C1BED20|nr:CBO0543 family protein [Lentibacillus sediminis]
MEMYATAWFALTFVMTVDMYLSYRFGLYDYLIPGIIDWGTLIIIFGVFPAYNIIFLNFFPKTRPRQILYIMGHAVIITTYEWICIQTGAFHHSVHWKLGYSALLYPSILLLLYWNLKILRILKMR